MESAYKGITGVEMRKIIILPLAEQDIKQSYEFYAAKKTGLEQVFLQVIDQAIQIVCENPQSFPIVKKKIRKFVVKDFPYVIYYISKAEVVYILAVFHMSRRPVVWKKRKQP
jgi:plasmid stabilization system protein ParE